MAAQSETPAHLKALVDNMGCKGCYGIEWECNDGIIETKSIYNPQWRIEEVAGKGQEGLYTTKSTRFKFGLGEGVVGTVFQQKKVVFRSDLQDLTSEGIAESMKGWDTVEFARADLAKQYGICSAVFLPTAAGVFEFGSTEKVATVPTFLSHEAKGIIEANDGCVLAVEWDEVNGLVVPVGHYAPEVPAACDLVNTLYGTALENPVLLKAARERQVLRAPGQHTLAKLFGLSPGKDSEVTYWPVPGSATRVIEVAFAPGAKHDARMSPNVCSGGLSTACRLLGAPIAVEWRKSGDSIVCAGHYNSEERVAICADKFGGARWTLESYKYSFKAGEGVVGRTFASGVSELIPDLLQMTRDSLHRHELAVKFDVRTAVFLAVKAPDGSVESVFEICTDRVCQMFEADIAKSESVPKNVLSELSTLAAPGMNSIY